MISCSKRPLILLTNDDGIASPGLRALAHAVEGLGDVLIAAPREQQSAMGRGLGRLGEVRAEALDLDMALVGAYSVEGSPAMAARVGMMLLAQRDVAVAVAGINYGENIGIGVTISGTVGAAMETASFGVPSVAISLETDVSHHFSHSSEIEFEPAAAFVRRVVAATLRTGFAPGVDVLKIDVPCDANNDTPWRLTTLTRQRYFESVIHEDAQGARRLGGYMREIDEATLEPTSDAYALLRDRVISVCPLTIDLSALDCLDGAREWPVF